MTIASTTAKSGPYNGNGSTTVFNYGFKVFDEDDLVVTLLTLAGTEVVQTLTTDYTVTGVGDVSGGTIVMGTAPATGEQLVITRAVPLLQGLDLQNRKAVTPELIERSLDILTQITQDLNERVDRSLKIDVFETVNLDQLLTNVNAVSAITAELVTVAGISTEVVAVAGDATDIGTVAAIGTEIGALGALTTELLALYAIRTDISTVAADGTDIGTVAGLSAEVAALAALSSELVALDAIIADISTVAGINSDVTTLAAISSAVSTLAAISANISTVAGISANVTAVAAIDSAVTSVAQLYQGASATNPTVRALDGSALQVGDFYLNTVTPAIRYVSSTGPVVWSELTTLIDESTLATMGVTATAAEINTLDGITASVTELNYTNGVTGAIQTQLDAKSPIASPTFTGTPAAPTPAAATNTTQIATTAYTRLAVPDVLNASGSAPVYAVRAWGRFDGDAVTTLAAGNLSIARTATGNFTFTMATALPDANYSVVITSSLVTGPIVANVSISSSSSFSCTMRRSSSEAAVNPTQIFVQVVR